ncbi:MAG: hypothetical protein M3P18_09265, partial [Actinomycetota bacterium]|nr:hypothetical protein [Actinomycetota bacterium]
MRAMLEAPVPLIVGTAIEAVGLDEVDVLYVDDAPDRRVFLTADERHPFLPATPRSAQAGLVTALRELLGAGRVKYTSEASVETGFVPATPGEPLIDFLARNEGQRLRDVALLVAYGRHIEANPSHEAFQRLWRVFEKTTIRLGTFGPKAARVRCFFESQPPDGPRLDVAVPDNPLDVVRSLWMIFGEDARDPFAAYVTAVERGERDTFFDERGIRMLEEREIDAFLGTSDIGRLYSFRDAVFALWCRSRDGGPVDFETEWLERDGFDAVARWLEVDRERLSELARAADDEERLRIMQSVGVSLSAWQRARVRLGLPPIEFERGYREFDTLRSEVIWGLAAVAAHASGVNLDEAYAALAPTLANAPPAAIRHRPHVEPGDLMAVLQEVRERLQTRDGVSLLTGRVDAALGEPSGDLDHFTISGDRRREVQDYRDIPEPLRVAWAHDALDSLLRVASALALHHTIPFTVEHVRDDPRIVQLTTGWWANRFAVLDAAQRSIRAEAGDVLAERLSRGRAFHDPTSNWRELWRKFPELGASPDEEEPDVSARIEIGGQELTHASAFRDLRQRGSDGLIAQRLRAAVDPGLSLSALRDVERAAPAPGRNRRRAPGEPAVRVSKPPRNETPADRDLNGLIGEAFVFEQLRVLLEDFDDTAWISENRSRYGLLSGPNEQRYDFRYRDIRNALTLPGGQPECHIEVKATSGDGNSPFPMSVPEWEHAIACHHSREATYVVI